MSGSGFLPMVPSLKERDQVNEEEAKLIWHEAKKPLTRELIKTLWYAGLRITEALTLKASDVRRDGLDFNLLVWTEKVGKKKGENKPDSLPIPRELGLDLYDYIKTQGIKPGDRLFPISRTTAWRQVKDCAKRAGLPNLSEIHPHSFRHGFVYDKVGKKIHPYVLSKLARHRDLKTTLGYYTPTEDDLRQAMEQ